MKIINPQFKKRKAKKPDAKARELQASWEKLMAAHATPLVKGAKANGVKIDKPKKVKQVPALFTAPIAQRTHKLLPVPITSHVPGTKPVSDELAAAKHALKSRLGQVYPKGAPQYMTDSDLRDSKDGLLRRRS